MSRRSRSFFYAAEDGRLFTVFKDFTSHFTSLFKSPKERWVGGGGCDGVGRGNYRRASAVCLGHLTRLTGLTGADNERVPSA